MQDKFFFKRNSTILTVINIIWLITIIILTIVYFWFKFSNLGFFAFLINIALFLIIVLSVVGLLFNIFITPKLLFIKLTDTEILVYGIFYRGLLAFIPKSFKYSDIKRIVFSEGMFKGIDTGSYAPWLILLSVDNLQEFIKELSSKYKQNTGNDLVIEEKF